MTAPREQKKYDGGLCPNCKVGRMRNTGITYTEADEIKTLFACDECNFGDPRPYEPPHGEGV